MTPQRLARTVALAVIIGIGIFNLIQAVTHWTLSDAVAYWDAGMRLRDGGPLYPELTNYAAPEVYRYAPWFAWLTIPLTFLPAQLVGGVWSVVLLSASGVAVVPIIRARAWPLVAFFLPILIGISAVGNVHALVVAWLVHGVGRRSGPFWIALAASLKIVPILLVVVYAGRREWWRVGASVVMTAALWAPALLYNMREYPTQVGPARSLITYPLLYGLVIGAVVLAAFLLARTRFGWLAGALAVVLAGRLFVYDVTYLMAGLPISGPGPRLDERADPRSGRRSM